MTFIVNGIRQEKNTQYPVEMLLDISSLSSAKQLLASYGILILTIKPYTQDKSTFGNISITLQYNKQIGMIVLKNPDIQNACNNVVNRWAEVKSIDTYPSSITPIESEKIIAHAVALLSTTQSQQGQERTSTSESIAKYPDHELKQVKAIVELVFEKIRVIQNKAQDVMNSQEIKTLTTLTDNLKKIRMGNNIEKIREIIENIIDILSEIEKKYYADVSNISPIVSGSQITQQNVDQEISLWENIRILQSLGARISIKNKDYARFGKRAIIRKFIQQDCKIRCQNIAEIVYRSFDVAQLVIIMVTIAVGGYATVNDMYMLFANQVGLAYMAISMGVRGGEIMVARVVRNKNIGRSILIIGSMIGFHYLLMRIININFAL